MLEFLRIASPFLALGLAAAPFGLAGRLLIRRLGRPEAARNLNLALVLLIFFSLFTLRLWPGPPPVNIYDDDDYLAHGAALAFFDFPEYRNEHLAGEGRTQPIGAPGPALVASPFLLAGALADRAMAHSIAEKRRLDNREGSNLHFAFVTATVLTFTLSVYLWAVVLGAAAGSRAVFLALLGGLFLIGLPIVVWRRPVFSHGYEFFLQTVWLVWLWDELRERLRRPPSPLWLLTLAAMSALTVLTRYNNAVFALVWPALLVGARLGGRRWLKGLASRGGPLGLTLTYLAALCFTAWFVVLPDFFNPAHAGGAVSAGYEATVGRALGQLHAWPVYLRRFWHVLTGPDMGLIFSAPALLLGLWALPRATPARLKPFLIPLLLAAAPTGYLVLAWGSFGSSYGYRYLVFSLAPLALPALTGCLQNWLDRNRRLWVGCYGLALAAPFLSQVFFQSVFEWRPMPNWFALDGALTMGRPFFQMEIYHFLLTEPGEFARQLVKLPLQALTFPVRGAGGPVTEGRYLFLFALPVAARLALRWLTPKTS